MAEPESLARESGPTEHQDSQTAQDYIASQLTLEADAREALPYQFDTCTKPLGPLRQAIYACLTCTPPPASPHQQFTPAGVCYSCSISCHGEHTLVELFSKRNFTCDCGTTRFATSGTPCSLRPNAITGSKGGVTGEEARKGNEYNHNFQGKFCGCGEEYDPEKEKGTMFQCIGLGDLATGGCGEDWWHPECLMGLPRSKPVAHKIEPRVETSLETVKEEEGVEGDQQDEIPPVEDDTPPGFPDEDDFDNLICHKCVDAFPWIKQYAGTPGFLPAVSVVVSPHQDSASNVSDSAATTSQIPETNKRKAQDDVEESKELKKAKISTAPDEKPTISEKASMTTVPAQTATSAKHATLPAADPGSINIFVTEDFREHLCRCPECFPRLAKHPQLLEMEETYEPPVSESDAPNEENRSNAGRSVNSGSIYDRGEAALSSVDRVRAIEGVMAYNHLRDKVKAFLRPFADSGQTVGAEDIKAYFAKLRGDEQAMREAAVGAGGAGAVQGDGRREQGGY